jgi:outer membrane protein assembly factor BamA
VHTDTLEAKERPYHSHFTLDFAQGGVALEPVQGVGEGVQALLSDQLGNEQILFQFSNTATSFDDILGRFNVGASYFNLRRRINYGGSVFHFAGDFLDEAGFRYFERRMGAAATISYPYTKFSRVESSFGILYSDREADTFRPGRKAFLATNYLSYIFDNTLWFPTGPMDGHRFRVTLGLNTGLDKVEVENISALVDVRRYFRTGLRTCYAVRLQGNVSEGTLPQRFVLGGSWSFRGYPRRSLVGTRSLLLNQEMRFPLLEGVAVGFPFGTIGLPSVQGALFLDAAQAWEEGESPDEVLGSFGLGLRTNLGGFLVLRLDFAKRTDFETIKPKTDVDFFVGFNY